MLSSGQRAGASLLMGRRVPLHCTDNSAFAAEGQSLCAWFLLRQAATAAAQGQAQPLATTDGRQPNRRGGSRQPAKSADKAQKQARSPADSRPQLPQQPFILSLRDAHAQGNYKGMRRFLQEQLDQPTTTYDLYEALKAVALLEAQTKTRAAPLVEQIMAKLGNAGEGPQTLIPLSQAQRASLLKSLATDLKHCWNEAVENAFLAMARSFVGDVAAAGAVTTSPGDLSNAISALAVAAKDRKKPPASSAHASLKPLLLQLQRDGLPLVPAMDSQGLTDVLEVAAYITKSPDGGLDEEVAAAVCGRWLQLLQPPQQGRATYNAGLLVRSLLALGKSYPSVKGPFVERAVQGIQQAGGVEGITPQERCHLLLSLAMLRYYDAGLFTSLAASITAQLDRCSCVDLSHALYSLAEGYHLEGSRQLVDNIVPHMTTSRRQFPVVEISKSCWALAVLGLADHPAMQALMKEACSRKLDNPAPAMLCYLFQAHLELQDLGLASELSSRPSLLTAAQAAWKKQQAEAPPASSSLSISQAQVEAALRRLFPEAQVQREGATRDGLFRVDALVTWPAAESGAAGAPSPKAVAVVVDGPSRFAANVPGRYGGSSELRNRQLARRLPLVVLDVQREWDIKSGQEREQLLREKVQQALDMGKVKQSS